MSGEQLIDFLQELRGELQIRNNPEQLARSALKPNRYGWTEEIYNDKAFQIWEDLLHRFPDDLNTMHHLAIMHHARAFDLEQGVDPTISDADWERALQLWHRLWSDDNFWESMIGHMGEDATDQFRQARAELSEELLQIHFDIAFDESTKNYRARSHIRFALESPFPQEVKDKVRLCTYKRLVGSLPSVVWMASTIDSFELYPAIEAVLGYLGRDEDFVPALTDLLRLLVNLQSGYVAKANTATNGNDLQNHLQEAQELASRYDQYMRRLEGHHLDDAPELFSNLVVWHSRSGQVLSMLKSYETAASHYKRALLAARQDGSDLESQEKMRREHLLCVVMAAQEEAARGEPGKARARELLDYLASEEKLPSACLMWRASARMLLGELDAAEKDCQAALETAMLEEEGLDPELVANAPQLKSICRELQGIIGSEKQKRKINQAISRAIEDITASRWKSALDTLNEADSIYPENASILYYRAQCLLGMLEVDRARADLASAESAAKAARDLDILDAISLLRKELERINEEIDLQMQLSQLFTQAVGCAKSGDFSGARRLCDRIIKARPGHFLASYLRAQCNFALGNLDKADADLRSAEASAGQDSESQSAVAGLRLQINQARRNKVENGHFQRADKYIQKGDFVRAARCCDQVLDINPDHLSALFLRAQCRMRKGDYLAAKEDLDHASAIAKRDGIDEAVQAASNLQQFLQMLRH